MSGIVIRRLDSTFAEWDKLLWLIRTSFAFMDGRIDPPSSAIALSISSLQQKAGAEIAFIALHQGNVAGCIFCRPEEECLYIGKLAVLPDLQGKGVGRRLLAVAEDIARERKLSALRLETRIELTENHATFAVWGFAKTAENAHPGFTRTTSIEMQKPLPPLTDNMPYPQR